MPDRAPRRRRYTAAELEAYQLIPVRSASGEILRYTVLIAGEALGSVERAPYGRSGWQARYRDGGAVRHSGRGRYATNRQSAVVDLLIELGITSTGR